jgi:hypothetical protein
VVLIRGLRLRIGMGLRLVDRRSIRMIVMVRDRDSIAFCPVPSHESYMKSHSRVRRAKFTSKVEGSAGTVAWRFTIRIVLTT